MLTRRPLDLILGTPMPCGTGIGFLPEPAEGGGQVSGGAPGTGGTAPVVDADGDVVTKSRRDYEDELRRVGAREKAHGARSGLNDWARSKGYDDPAKIEEILVAHAQQQQAAMTEADRVRAAADEKMAKATELLDTAKKATFRANAIAALRSADAQDPALLAPGLTEFGVTIDSTEDEIAEAVEKMKSRLPGSFGARPTGTPGSNPGAPPAGSPQGGDSGVGNLGHQATAQLERVQNRRGGVPIPTLGGR